MSDELVIGNYNYCKFCQAIIPLGEVVCEDCKKKGRQLSEEHDVKIRKGGDFYKYYKNKQKINKKKRKGKRKMKKQEMLNYKLIDDIIKHLFEDKYDKETKFKAMGYLKVGNELVDYIEKYYPELILEKYQIDDEPLKEVMSFIIKDLLNKKFKIINIFTSMKDYNGRFDRIINLVKNNKE